MKLTHANFNLLAPGEPFLVGVSGGADSVALLDALVQAGHHPHVCHLNHRWRGADSDADAEFVREIAGRYNLPVTIESCSIAHEEDAGRKARFDFFESVAKHTGIHTIALAHTADDQVETFLMRLIRGAGTTGLAGILPNRKIGTLRVIRPLLDVSRQEVLEYLRSRNLTWHEDASNADRQFLRNRIRHELLPLLERDYNPGIRDVLRRTSEILRAEVESDPVAQERRAVRSLSFEQVEAIRRQAKREVPKPVRGRWPINLAGETELPELGVRLAAGETGERFDADALGASPFVRTWQTGDRFQPLGMTGEKKLQDFFVDEKIPRDQRGRVPLLCASDGRIAWVVGYRIADPFKVTDATRRVLQIGVRG